MSQISPNAEEGENTSLVAADQQTSSHDMLAPTGPRKHHIRRLIILLSGVVSLIVLSIVIILHVRHTAVPTQRTLVPTPSPTSQRSNNTTSSLKPPLQGLIDRGNVDQFSMPSSQEESVIQAIVANVKWADVQSASGGAIIRGSANQLDTAITEVTSYNSTHPNSPLSIKLRIRAGTDAPDWAKRLGGFNPIYISNKQSGASGTIGPFWITPYATAYQDFVAKLAAIYDSNSLLREVAISQCMTAYAEPFQRDDVGFDLLYAQGYNINDDKYCLQHQVDGFKPWATTRVSLAFNSFKPWIKQANGNYTQTQTDETFTASVMDYCRQVLGSRCTLENNSIRSSFVGNESTPGTLYYDLKQRGPNTTYQTAQTSTVGDLQATLQWAIQIGANAVELPAKNNSVDSSTLGKDNQALIANPTK